MGRAESDIIYIQGGVIAKCIVNYTESYSGNTSKTVTITNVQLACEERTSGSWAFHGSFAATDYNNEVKTGAAVYTGHSDGWYYYTIDINIARTWSRTTSQQTKNITVTGMFDYPGSVGAHASFHISFNSTIDRLPYHTVAYNPNGGSGQPGNQTKWWGINLTLSSTKPTRSNYTFRGWSTSQNGTVVYQPGSTYTTNATSGTVTLYAVWSFTISYNANGEGVSGLPAAQTKYIATNITLSTMVPTREGYVFQGWSTSSSGSVNYQPGNVYSSNEPVILYAIWHKNLSATVNTTSVGPYYNAHTSYSISLSDVVLYDDASITSVTLTIGTLTVTSSSWPITIDLEHIGSFEPIVIVTDSLNSVQNYSLPVITVKEYESPSLVSEVFRTSSLGKVEEEGIYAIIHLKVDFIDDLSTSGLIKPTVTINDEAEGAESFSIVWYYNWTSSQGVSTPVDWNNPPATTPVDLYGLTTKADIPGEVEGFSIYRTYDISAKIKDSFDEESILVLQRLAPAFYTIDFLAGGHGIAFGRPSTEEGFYCGMEAYFLDKEGLTKTLVDFFYPIGSYYETSDVTFNPNLTWGGTWVKESEGLVHVSAGTNYVVSGANLLGGQGQQDGGNKDAIIPLHDHPFTNPEYQAKDGAVGDKAAFNTGAMSSNAKHSHSGWGESTASNWTLSNGVDIGFHRSAGISETNIDHTHQVPKHGHTFTQPTISLKSGKGGVVNSVGESVIDANMQPHINVVKWHRIPDPE